MVNPILDAEQLTKANELLNEVRKKISDLAGGDPELLFAYRRKIAKMLVYDERSGPNERRKLKALKRKQQNGCCDICKKKLPDSYNVLDRFTAIGGYTDENTRLICEPCDRSLQGERRYQ